MLEPQQRRGDPKNRRRTAAQRLAVDGEMIGDKTAAAITVAAVTQEKKPVVMLVEGWSLGPLLYLRAGLKRGNRVRIIQPRLPMPPLLGWWFWDLNFFGLFTIFVVYCLVFVWPFVVILLREGFHDDNNDNKSPLVAKQSWTKWMLLLVFHLILILGAIRIMAAVVVRSSKRKGMEICLREIRDHKVSVVVAFSWGGAVVTELLAAGYLNNHNDDHVDDNVDDDETQLAVLLLAPANTLVAQVALQQDPLLDRLPTYWKNRRRDTTTTATTSNLVCVVHASDDSKICPHPQRWDLGNASGISYEMLNDVHIFQKRSSKQRLCAILEHLLRQKTKEPNESYWIPPSAEERGTNRA